MATVTPGLPLPLRNALAEIVIAALDDDAARDALTWLAALDPPASGRVMERLHAVHLIDVDGVLLAVHAPHAARLRAHAARGLEAATVHRMRRDLPSGWRPEQAGERAIACAITQAVALWNAGLFFEVHEVLEAVWTTTEGGPRQALQALIQIAVAFHHHAHGNVRGARTLMREGRARLAAHRAILPTLDATALLADTAPWETWLAADATPDGARPPTLRQTSGA